MACRNRFKFELFRRKFQQFRDLFLYTPKEGLTFRGKPEDEADARSLLGELAKFDDGWYEEFHESERESEDQKHDDILSPE